MPRVKLYKKKYTEDDLYLYIKLQMKMQGMNQSDLGKVTGDSQQNFSRKMLQHDLNLKDIIALFDLFGTDQETAGQLMTGKWKVF